LKKFKIPLEQAGFLIAAIPFAYPKLSEFKYVLQEPFGKLRVTNTSNVSVLLQSIIATLFQTPMVIVTKHNNL
jgi:hypothetical protein